MKPSSGRLGIYIADGGEGVDGSFRVGADGLGARVGSDLAMKTPEHDGSAGDLLAFRASEVETERPAYLSTWLTGQVTTLPT